ncbi:hypothetical protein DL93DRAFT_1617389 [Clavulina sp. PMI_390]|nr:hypothetical protein DL93DRAFT_1617389 [Clavulina sp. PMI_390]
MTPQWSDPSSTANSSSDESRSHTPSSTDVSAPEVDEQPISTVSFTKIEGRARAATIHSTIPRPIPVTRALNRRHSVSVPQTVEIYVEESEDPTCITDSRSRSGSLAFYPSIAEFSIEQEILRNPSRELLITDPHPPSDIETLPPAPPSTPVHFLEPRNTGPAPSHFNAQAPPHLSNTRPIPFAQTTPPPPLPGPTHIPFPSPAPMPMPMPVPMPVRFLGMHFTPHIQGPFPPPPWWNNSDLYPNPTAHPIPPFHCFEPIPEVPEFPESRPIMANRLPKVPLFVPPSALPPPFMHPLPSRPIMANQLPKVPLFVPPQASPPPFVHLPPPPPEPIRFYPNPAMPAVNYSTHPQTTRSAYSFDPILHRPTPPMHNLGPRFWSQPSAPPNARPNQAMWTENTSNLLQGPVAVGPILTPRAGQRSESASQMPRYEEFMDAMDRRKWAAAVRVCSQVITEDPCNRLAALENRVEAYLMRGRKHDPSRARKDAIVLRDTHDSKDIRRRFTFKSAALEAGILLTSVAARTTRNIDAAGATDPIRIAFAHANTLEELTEAERLRECLSSYGHDVTQLAQIPSVEADAAGHVDATLEVYSLLEPYQILGVPLNASLEVVNTTWATVRRPGSKSPLLKLYREIRKAYGTLVVAESAESSNGAGSSPSAVDDKSGKA